MFPHLIADILIFEIIALSREEVTFEVVMNGTFRTFTEPDYLYANGKELKGNSG